MGLELLYKVQGQADNIGQQIVIRYASHKFTCNASHEESKR